MEKRTVIMDENGIHRALARITYEIIEHNKGTQDVCLVGILSRGAIIARRMADKLRELEGISVDCGVLDITPYRDDLFPDSPREDKTRIDFSTKEKHVVICDDVLYTGRSTRAAIDAVIERGRPRSIQLAVLVDRGHREVPIRPDYVGRNLPTSRSERVEVHMKELDGEENVCIVQPDIGTGEGL